MNGAGLTSTQNDEKAPLSVGASRNTTRLFRRFVTVSGPPGYSSSCRSHSFREPLYLACCRFFGHAVKLAQVAPQTRRGSDSPASSVAAEGCRTAGCSRPGPPAELLSLHSSSPVPSNTLSRLPRNRQPSPEPSPQPAPTLRSIRASRLRRLLNPRPTA